MKYTLTVLTIMTFLVSAAPASAQVAEALPATAAVSASTTVSAETVELAPLDELTLAFGGVKTAPDLDAYVASIIEQDENASRIFLGTDDSVSLTYREPAKYLWFIPGTIGTTVTVSSTGSTTLAYPWYGFLASKDHAALESNARVFAGRIAKFESAASAEVKARIISALRLVMKDNLEGINTLDR